MCCTLRMVLIMYLSSWDTKNTLPLLPGLGSSRSAWSPAQDKQDAFHTCLLRRVLTNATGYRAPESTADHKHKRHTRPGQKIDAEEVAPPTIHACLITWWRTGVCVERAADGLHVLGGLNVEDGAQVAERERAIVLPAEVGGRVRGRVGAAVAREVLLQLRARARPVGFRVLGFGVQGIGNPQHNVRIHGIEETAAGEQTAPSRRWRKSSPYLKQALQADSGMPLRLHRCTQSPGKFS